MRWPTRLPRWTKAAWWLAYRHPAQLRLPLLDLAPSSVVVCLPMSCTLPAKACVARHAARTARGGGRGFPIHPACARCTTGEHRQVLLAAVGWVPPAYRPFNVARDRAQRAARWVAQQAGLLDDLPTVDGLPLTLPREMR